MQTCKKIEQRTEKFVRKRNVYVFGGYMALLGMIIGLVYEGILYP